MKIRIGTRKSKLAMIQANIVKDTLLSCAKELEIEVVPIVTTGDKILDRTLDKIGGKGLFVKELDQALLEGRIDLAVHSLKDVPMEIDDRIPLLGFSKRENPKDALILKKGVTNLDPKMRIGTSSNRRKYQLLAQYPNMTIKEIRGNVQTRLRKLEEEELEGIILAMAGLKRLGLEEMVAKEFSVLDMIPAAGQGILTVQGRKDFPVYLLKNFSSPESAIMAQVERSFVSALQGNCSSPIGAYCEIEGEIITCHGFYQHGERTIQRSKQLPLSKWKELGPILAKEME